MLHNKLPPLPKKDDKSNSETPNSAFSEVGNPYNYLKTTINAFPFNTYLNKITNNTRTNMTKVQSTRPLPLVPKKSANEFKSDFNTNNSPFSDRPNLSQERVKRLVNNPFNINSSALKMDNKKLPEIRVDYSRPISRARLGSSPMTRLQTNQTDESEMSRMKSNPLPQNSKSPTNTHNNSKDSISNAFTSSYSDLRKSMYTTDKSPQFQNKEVSRIRPRSKDKIDPINSRTPDLIHKTTSAPPQSFGFTKLKKKYDEETRLNENNSNDDISVPEKSKELEKFKSELNGLVGDSEVLSAKLNDRDDISHKKFGSTWRPQSERLDSTFSNRDSEYTDLDMKLEGLATNRSTMYMSRNSSRKSFADSLAFGEEGIKETKSLSFVDFGVTGLDNEWKKQFDALNTVTKNNIRLLKQSQLTIVELKSQIKNLDKQHRNELDNIKLIAAKKNSALLSALEKLELKNTELGKKLAKFTDEFDLEYMPNSEHLIYSPQSRFLTLNGGEPDSPTLVLQKFIEDQYHAIVEGKKNMASIDGLETTEYSD